MVTFRLNLIAHGWAECAISDGATGATATASYLSDGIGDFIAALQSLFRSAKSASCEFAEEPGAFLWELERCDSDVLIRLQWLPEDGTPENRFSVSCDLTAFAKQVDAEFDRNLGVPTDLSGSGAIGSPLRRIPG